MAARTLLRDVTLLLALGLALSAGASGASQNRDATVGTEGELYVLHEGTYGELFPAQGLADPGNAALALEVTHPDRQTERLLVPGTETDDVELSPSALFEDDSGTLFLLWQTNRNYVHSWLNLVGYRDGEWTEPIEITGSPIGWKSSPQLAITRDSFRTELDDGTFRTWKRTVVHLIWWEDASNGPRVFYSPVVLLDGEYSGWNAVYQLDDLISTTEAPLTQPNLALAQAPRLQAGSNGQSVVIGFVPTGTSELMTVVLELLPGEIGFLADDIRHQIIDVGRQTRDEGGPSALAGKVRHQIIDVGARLKLHPGLTSYVADKVHAQVAGSSPTRPVASLADDVRHQIIDVGAHMTDRGFDRLGAKSSYRVVEVGSGGPGASSPVPLDLIRVVQSSSRPVPQTGEAVNALHLSADGKGIIVSWESDSALFYRESRGSAGWSDPHRLRLVGDMDLQRAHSLLERRAEERSTTSP